MNCIIAQRWDEEENESTINFWRNMLWGMWTNNEYINVIVTCGKCNCIIHGTTRQKSKFFDCPWCETRNLKSE